MNGRIISTSAHSLSQKLDDFAKSVSRSALMLRTKVQDLQASELVNLTSYVERIDQQLMHLQNIFDAIQNSNSSESDALQAAQKVLEERQKTFTSNTVVWSKRLVSTCQEMCTNIKLAGAESFIAVEADLKTMSSLMDTVVREALEHLNFEHSTVHEVKIEPPSRYQSPDHEYTAERVPSRYSPELHDPRDRHRYSPDRLPSRHQPPDHKYAAEHMPSQYSPELRDSCD
jgi:hypothetical protein